MPLSWVSSSISQSRSMKNQNFLSHRHTIHYSKIKVMIKKTHKYKLSNAIYNVEKRESFK
jgi:hypothetical protein